MIQHLIEVILGMMMIPLHSDLNEFIPTHQFRFNQLLSTFNSIYNQFPKNIIRSPGRVNIIGEHIDYSGLSVLPAAIQRDVLIAITINPTTSKLSSITLNNISSSKYTSVQFDVDLNGDGSDVIMPHVHHWSNYFKAGTKVNFNPSA